MRTRSFTDRMSRYKDMSDPAIQTNERSARQSNLELLRILSMCMIITMHYMTKGMKIEKLSLDCGLRNAVFWILYAFCLSSVNVYVFLSGYFAIDSKWSIGKLLRLWAEVLFYSIGVPLVLSVFGVFDIRSAGLSVWQQIFLPVTYEHYWFATAYIMLFLLSPILNIAIAKLEKKSFQAVLLALIAVFCGLKSVNPYLIPWDRYGNDVMWFIVLYLTAGYLRVHGMPFVGTADGGKRRRNGWAVYVIFSLLTFAAALAYAFFVRLTGKFAYSMDMTYCYNYITVFLASIGLFAAFAGLRIGHIPWINRIAGYTFGVYLLHDNIVLREMWPLLPGMAAASGKWWQLFHMLVCVAAVFAIGAFVDFLRDGLFRAIAGAVKGGKES